MKATLAGLALLALAFCTLVGVKGVERWERRDACGALKADVALKVARVARLEAELRFEDAVKEAKEGADWECDLACAASHRLRNELDSDVREAAKGLRPCGVEP